MRRRMLAKAARFQVFFLQAHVIGTTVLACQPREAVHGAAPTNDELVCISKRVRDFQRQVPREFLHGSREAQPSRS